MRIGIAIVLLTMTVSGWSALAKECAFCNPEIVEKQSFYEGEAVLALYTHKPIYPGHCLIIPKRHVERLEELSSEEGRELVEVTQRVHAAVRQLWGTEAYLLLQKNGEEVGQTVPHVHMHYIPRKAGDGSVIKFLGRMFWAALSSPISAADMEEAVQNLRKAMEAAEAAPEEGYE